MIRALILLLTGAFIAAFVLGGLRKVSRETYDIA